MKPIVIVLAAFVMPLWLRAQNTAAGPPARPAAQPFAVHVFPNPTPGPLVVQIDPLHAAVDLMLFDAQNHAVLVREKYTRIGTAPLDLKKLPPGRYRLRVSWNGQIREVEVARAVDPLEPAAGPLIGSSQPAPDAAPGRPN